jgi:hypothetical protein
MKPVPDLDWKAFRTLPGASWRNWELPRKKTKK